MNTLGGISLPAQMIWVEKYTSRKIAASATPTLDGGLIVNQQSLRYSDITLEAREEVAWLDQVTVDALLAIVVAGAQFTLVWDGVTYTVVPRHQDAPAFEFQPLWPFYSLYTGRLKLTQI